jgi:hypothetical protein
MATEKRWRGPCMVSGQSIKQSVRERVPATGAVGPLRQLHLPSEGSALSLTTMCEIKLRQETKVATVL